MKKLFVVVVLAGAVGGGVMWWRSAQVEAAPTPLTTAVSRGSVVQLVEATGSLQTVTTVDVGTQVSGTIKELYADFNSVVRRGDLIAELEPSLFESQVEQAKATLVRVEADLDRARMQVEDTEVKLKRARSLIERDTPLIPPTELEAAEMNARGAISSLRSSEAQLVQAQAALNQAEVNLSHTKIYAPIDGIVISRAVNVGQTVAASTSAPTLFLIARDLRDMQVQASVDESDIGKIQEGQAVRFRVDAYPNQEFRGVLRQVRLQPVVTQNVVSYSTIIDVRNEDQLLKPGMTATLAIEVARADDVLRVPNSAIRFRPNADTFAALGQPVPAAFGGGGAPAPDDAPGQTAGRGNMTPEQMEEMRQRFATMSEAERAQMGRGGAAGGRGGFAGRGGGAPGGQRAGGSGGGGGAAGSVVEIWVLSNGQLEPRRVRTGIADTTNTAILDGLNEGDLVVTGMAVQQVASGTGASAVRNPLMPNVGRGGGRGGRGGF
jgi:HlyD family secretion protein